MEEDQHATTAVTVSTTVVFGFILVIGLIGVPVLIKCHLYTKKHKRSIIHNFIACKCMLMHAPSGMMVLTGYLSQGAIQYCACIATYTNILRLFVCYYYNTI